MKLVKKGAEADIYLTEHDGRKAILKFRKPKPYIDPKLDGRIRKTRTLREAQMIYAIKSIGINAPLVFDLDTKQCKIIMQYIRGTVVGQMRPKEMIKACRKIGRIIAQLHKNGIVHGDITTSNFIAFDQKIFVIDLGLSFRTQRNEDYAVDLRLFKAILNSAHTINAESAWRSFVLGYTAVIGRTRFIKILKIIADIELRGRYTTVR